MSTLSLSHSDAIRVRRLPVSGMILVLSALLVLGIFILVRGISASHADPTGQAAISQSSNALIAVPVPTPSPTGAPSIATETPAPHPEQTSEPSVVPVPVPTAPSPVQAFN